MQPNKEFAAGVTKTSAHHFFQIVLSFVACGTQLLVVACGTVSCHLWLVELPGFVDAACNSLIVSFHEMLLVRCCFYLWLAMCS